MKQRVLILCTGNSCRSQMAEGLWSALGGDEWEVCSAGSRPAGFVHPLAVEALHEIGIDISGQRSKHVDEFADGPFDVVVTVCDQARDACPVLPGATQTLHWPFADPAAHVGDRPEQVTVFRRVRDQIAAAIRAHLGV